MGVRPARIPPQDDLKRFAEAIRHRQADLLQKWRIEIRRLSTARNMDTPTLNDHIPALLDHLASALTQGDTQSVLDLQLERSPQVHGTQRLRAGFDIVEVVAEYNILRELLHELSGAERIDLSIDISRIVNRVIDSAIALAVDTYAKEKALELQQRREEHLTFIMHDIRTPISAMHTVGQMLDRSLSPDAKTQRVQNMLTLLQRNTDRVNALLKVATQEQYNIATNAKDDLKVELRTFDLWPMVEGLIQDLRPLSESSPIRFINVIPADLEVFADAALLNQVFQNLISNAIEYTKTGQIVVGARHLDGESGDRCWVQDTGAGVSSDRFDRIFEKFESDPGKTHGQGLGLAIVKKIIEAHGGEVSVESIVGRGSKFTFTLPAAPHR